MICVDINRPTMKTRNWRYNTVCHLFSDTHNLAELHAFAEKIGLKRCWFQNHKSLPHYDITPNVREKAVAFGANEVTDQFMVSCYSHNRK